MSNGNQKAEIAGRNDFHVERGSDGKRIPHEVYLKTLEMNVKVVQPRWGDGKEFFRDFGSEDADAVDSEAIAKHLRKLVVKPDLSDLTADELDSEWDSAVVQELLDKMSNLYGGDEEEEEDEEANPKKSEKQSSEQ